jgi:hypothetical protein
LVTDRQVRKLFRMLSEGKPLSVSALATGMSERTARRYRALGKLPSETKVEHDWRTRRDPFEKVWPQVEEQLRLNPGLQAKTLFEWLQREHPGDFQDGQLRTLQRRIKQWRATEGPAKEVFFSQVHHPGDLAASDFTHMSSLGVTIAGQALDHLVYHFVLTYSNWESVSLCYSESFESLSDGLQCALWKLGGVPQRHRTDRLSAAVNNPSDAQEFTARYQGLMNHYGIDMEKTQPRHAHENGDVESSHHHFKTAVDQALMMRGSRDFNDIQAYELFLEEIADGRNAGRQQRLAEEREVLGDLRKARLDSYRTVTPLVNSGSLIQVLGNTYSVHSRLIGETVNVRVHADHLEVWYAQRRVDQFPRLRGRGKHRVNYRHIIDWLVRKPGAFENYRYREDLFPTSHFRMAFDSLRDRRSKGAATKDYLEILRLAAYESETHVDNVLRKLLTQATGEAVWTIETVRAELRAITAGDSTPSVTEVHIDEVDLTTFDHLLDDVTEWETCCCLQQPQDKEVFDDYHECETNAVRSPA